MFAPVRGISGLDRLAEELVASAALQLGVADSPAELIAAHRLRYLDAAQHGRARPEDEADGMQSDAYDSRALQICAWDGEALAGTLRLVLPMPDRPLPTEAAFGLTVEPAGEVVDVGAPLLAGGPSRPIGDALLAQGWFEARARGYLVMAGTVSSRLVARYRGLGLDVEVLAREGDRTAVRIDPSIG
jgi:hypothetical protein